MIFYYYIIEPLKRAQCMLENKDQTLSPSSYALRSVIVFGWLLTTRHQMPPECLHNPHDDLVLQGDLSDLDLETLAPYIPMDGEDFQLHPIVPDLEPMDPGSAAGGSLAGPHAAHPQHGFNTIASLFQPLSARGKTEGRYPWGPGEKRGSPHAPQGPVDPRTGSCMEHHARVAPHQVQASTPLSSMGGRQNVQWPPDPLLTYQCSQRAPEVYSAERPSGEERPTCQKNGLMRR